MKIYLVCFYCNGVIENTVIRHVIGANAYEILEELHKQYKNAILINFWAI